MLFRARIAPTNTFLGYVAFRWKNSRIDKKTTRIVRGNRYHPNEKNCTILSLHSKKDDNFLERQKITIKIPIIRIILAKKAKKITRKVYATSTRATEYRIFKLLPFHRSFSWKGTVRCNQNVNLITRWLLSTTLTFGKGKKGKGWWGRRKAKKWNERRENTVEYQLIICALWSYH